MTIHFNHATKNILLAVALLAITGCGGERILPTAQSTGPVDSAEQVTRTVSNPTPADHVSLDSGPLPQTEAEWKQRLTDDQYYVLRQKGTEYAYTGTLWNSKTRGTYVCAGCGQELFSSETKYESGTGWPSFYAPLADENVITRSDDSLFARRTEVVCGRCDGHLGHVFPDGPLPTGLRYCLNSAALELEPAEKQE